MSTERDVGIVMPVYVQRKTYLKQALRSVLNQSYEKFRLVIVLDGSPKEVEDVVNKEIKGDQRVKVIRFSSNHGVAAALNQGFASLLRHRDVRYLTWVSSDNIYYKNFIKVLRHAIRHADPNVGLVYSSFNHVKVKGVPVYDANFRREFMAWQNQPKEALLDTCFIGTSFMYKREYAERIGGYSLQPVEDYDYWLRLTEHCDIAFVSKILMEYRVSSEHSISRVLSSSKEQHRRWRHAFQAAKQQARMRRGISPTTTILIPIHTLSSDVINRCEKLYEQYYSNYYVCILDGTENYEATRKLSQISDPRVAFVHMPRNFTNTHVANVAKHVATPSVLIYDANSTDVACDLQLLVSTFQRLDAAVNAVSRNASTGEVGNANYTPGAGFESGVLYRTSAIL